MRARRILLTAILGAAALQAQPAAAQAPVHAWLQQAAHRTVADAFVPPAGFSRSLQSPDSFAHWLRHLPLKPESASIMLFDGRQRATQSGAAAIVDIDVGRRDLQQCADAVIRLRAEWLYATGQRAALSFAFTSGDRYAFADWLDGRTPVVSGNRVAWRTGGRRPADHAGLRRWLDIVFAYAGTLSLEREMARVNDIAAVAPGDVLLQGGSPGHAAIVLDVAHDRAGAPAVLLAQSFMPAQSLHVLRNPGGGVWFHVRRDAPIATPDWLFAPTDLHRFPLPR